MPNTPQQAREAGFAMGRVYVDRLIAAQPDRREALMTIRKTLRTKTLGEIQQQIMGDTLREPLLRSRFSESELQAYTEGFLESALARTDELVNSS